MGRKSSGVMVAHDDDFELRLLLPEQTGGLEAVFDGHADVEQDEVGREFAGEFDGLSAIGSFSANLKPVFAIEDAGETAANEFVIVCNQDAHESPLQRQRGQTGDDPSAD